MNHPGYGKNPGKGSKNHYKFKEKIVLLAKWNMPDALHEISGICWVDDQRLACVQDELGVIYIYNMVTTHIENQIPFAARGDFESITRAGSTYYVMRSDGQIFEIDTSSKIPVISQYSIPLDKTNNIEGIFYDKPKNRLLIAIKQSDPFTPVKIKGIYAFSLDTHQMSETPVFEIDLSSPVINKSGDDNQGDKKLSRVFLPSDIAIGAKQGW